MQERYDVSFHRIFLAVACYVGNKLGWEWGRWMQGDQKESVVYLRDRMMAMELLKSDQILDIEPTGFPDGVDMSMQKREKSRFLKDSIAIKEKVD